MGHEGYLSHKVTKRHKNRPLAKSEKEMPRAKMSQLRLRVSTCYRLLFAAKRNVTPYFADSIWMNVQERSDVLQVKKLHNAGTTLQQ